MRRRSKTRYFKLLTHDACAPVMNKFSYRRYLPKVNKDGTWTPGKWLPRIDERLEMCCRGYHVCKAADILHFAGGHPEYRMFEVRVRGTGAHRFDKSAFKEIRLLREIYRWQWWASRRGSVDVENMLASFDRQKAGVK